jgi:carbamate kinase
LYTEKAGDMFLLSSKELNIGESKNIVCRVWSDGSIRVAVGGGRVPLAINNQRLVTEEKVIRK